MASGGKVKSFSQKELIFPLLNFDPTKKYVIQSIYQIIHQIHSTSRDRTGKKKPNWICQLTVYYSLSLENNMPARGWIMKKQISLFFLSYQDLQGGGHFDYEISKSEKYLSLSSHYDHLIIIILKQQVNSINSVSFPHRNEFVSNKNDWTKSRNFTT